MFGVGCVWGYWDLVGMCCVHYCCDLFCVRDVDHCVGECWFGFVFVPCVCFLYVLIEVDCVVW